MALPERKQVFPRLAIVSDVSPEKRIASGLLLYRLLSEWPPERLLVLYGNQHGGPADVHRLRGVRYERIPYTIPRLHRSRLVSYVNLALTGMVQLATPSIEARLRAFKAEAIVAVTFGHLWLAAAAAARHLKLPLHIICHDDVQMNHPVPTWGSWVVDRAFSAVFRAAQTRLCVSPLMAEKYEYGFHGKTQVMYPNRGEDSPTPRVRVRPVLDGPPVLAYAGSIVLPGYAAALRRAADALEALGGRLDLYTDLSDQGLVRFGLSRKSVRLAGFLRPTELAERVAETAHALLCPASFRFEDEHAMQMLFPSKLADYTAIGLPIIIWGPKACAVIRWERDNPGAAVAITDENGTGLSEAIIRLARDTEFAVTVATKGVRAGEKDFSLAAGRAIFYAAICNNTCGEIDCGHPPALFARQKFL